MPDKKDLHIGQWWAPCCLHDLRQIINSDDLQYAKESDLFSGPWDTCAEAVQCLAEDEDKTELLFLVEWYKGEGNNYAISRELSNLIATSDQHK